MYDRERIKIQDFWESQKLWEEQIHNFITSFEWQQEIITCLLNSILITLLLKVKVGIIQVSHCTLLTDQAAEAMAAYRDQIAGLMLANNRHHWCHIFFFFLDEIDSLALMPCNKLFSYWLSFIALDNCYSFNLTYMIKVLGLNVIYETIDL